MLIVDDILGAPMKGVMWVLKEVAAAADQEMRAEGDRIREQLRELYQQLEQRRITDSEFDAREGVLLDRLDAIEADNPELSEDEGEDEDEDEDEDQDEDEDEDQDEEEEDDDDEDEDEDQDEDEDDEDQDEDDDEVAND